MNRKILQHLFFIFLGFSNIFFAYLIFSPISSQLVSINLLLYSIGKLAGLIGFLFLSILIISGDTARFFDRFLGMDRIIKFQRKFALITAIFIISHPIFFILSSVSYLNYLIPNFAVLPLALGPISLYIYVLVIISSILYKRISYQIWQYIHILTYILFFFSLYHALNVGSDTNNIFIKLILGILLIWIITGGIYRAYYKIKHMKFKCYVKEVKWETNNVFTLKIEPNRKMLFKPGQFCFLRLNKDKLYAKHPFTISSSLDENTLHFTMKITGRFTKTASQLKGGEEIILDGPFGIFTVENNKNLVFIAGGVGITPFMSMIAANSDKQQNITLLYCTRTKEDIIFKYRLDNISNAWFKKIYILSEEKKPDKGYECGRIRKEIIKEYIENVKNSLFYICGPEPMKNEVVKILRSMEVKKQNIKIESFFW